MISRGPASHSVDTTCTPSASASINTVGRPSQREDSTNAAARWKWGYGFETNPGSVWRAFRTGVWGDPRTSSAELGEQFYGWIEDGMVKLTITQRTGAIVEAVRRLDEAGVGVDDIGLKRPTLDDVFLTLTGHAAEEPQPENGEVRR